MAAAVKALTLVLNSYNLMDSISKDMTMYSFWRKWCIFSLLAVVYASTLHAQTTATEILGLVKDSSGAIISGAQITITRIATGTRLTKTTNAGRRIYLSSYRYRNV